MLCSRLANGLIAGVLMATLAVPAFATEDRGAPAPSNDADRTVKLRPDSKYLNVGRDETVTIMQGDKSFTWRFDTVGTPTFDLREIAPKDFGTSRVRVYVGPGWRELSDG